MPAARSPRATFEPWVQGCVVERISFRDGLVLGLADYNELVIAVPLRLGLPATRRQPAETVLIDPLATPDVQRPLFDFAGTRCTGLVWNEDGELHMEFSDGHHIDVSPVDTVTNWELYGKYHGYAACLGRGKVRVVRHDTWDED